MRAQDYPYRFNDVSEYRVITDGAAYQSARDVLITKATGWRQRSGGFFVDPTFGRHRAIGTKLTAMGLYCYIVGSSLASYKSQADYFSNAIGGLTDNEFIALDIEDSTISDPYACFLAMTAFLEQKHSCSCMLYIPDKYAKSLPRNVTGDRLVWAPKYSTVEPEWPFDIWQYTDAGTIPGCSLPGDTSVTKIPPEDILARTSGSSNDLLAWCAAHPAEFRSLLEEVF